MSNEPLGLAVPLLLFIEPFLLRMEDGSSEVGEVGRLELSNFNTRLLLLSFMFRMPSTSLGLAASSRKTVVFDTKDVFLLESSPPLVLEASKLLLGENVNDDLRPPPGLIPLKGVETPEEPLNTISLCLKEGKNC